MKQDFFFQVSSVIYSFDHTTLKKAKIMAQQMATQFGRCLLVSLTEEIEFIRN
jgi:hypothetical protein